MNNYRRKNNSRKLINNSSFNKIILKAQSCELNTIFFFQKPLVVSSTQLQESRF